MHSLWIRSKFQNELVSVIIPTYNRQVLLQEAIESVVGQTYRPLECIIVDDGSTDDTKNLVNETISKLNEDDFTIKYIYQPNSGAQVARNTGTLASNGEFIQYLDSDDLIFPEKIKAQVEFLKKNENCHGVFGDWRTGDKVNNIVVTAYAKNDLLDQMLTERCVHTLSFLMRRSVVAKIGAWDISLRRNQEIDYHLRGLLLDSVYQYYPADTGLHRQHRGEQITTTTGNKEILQFYEKWEKLLEKHNRFTKGIQQKLANLYIWYFLQDHKSVTSVNLLEAAFRLDPDHSIFSSRKLHVLQKCIGTRPALGLWFKWFIYIKKKQFVNEDHAAT